MEPASSKEIERTYYAQIGEAGMAHAMKKPFADGARAQLLLEFGAVLTVMPPPPGRVIDLGCGVGWTTDFLARSGYDAVGVDLAPEAVAAASDTYGSDTTRFFVHDYEEALPEAGTYDVALFFDALHHCTDAEAALQCAADALRPGGVCVVAEPGRGHHDAAGSMHVQEHFGVVERDMPPDLVLATARKVGFTGGTVYAFPAEVQHLVYGAPGPRRTGLRRLLDTRLGRSLLMVRAMDFNRHRSGLVRLVR